MICHKDKAFCESSGTCVNTECDRWINLGKDYELPVSLAEFKDTDHCAGFIEHPALTVLMSAVEVKQ